MAEMDRVHCRVAGDGSVQIRPENAWEGCPFCGPEVASHPYIFPALSKGLSLVRCNGCDLVYPRPRLCQAALDARVLAEVHQEYYRDAFAEQPLPRHAPADEIAFLRRELPIQSATEFRVLDVGCAGGDFLCSWRDLGCQVTGIEANPASAAYARKQGIQVEEGFFRTDEPDREPFDLITFRESLYHFFDVRQALDLAWSLLKPAGHIYVKVFNVDSFSFRTRADSSSGVTMLDIPSAFSPRSLCYALKHSNFHVRKSFFLPDRWLAEWLLPGWPNTSWSRRIARRLGNWVAVPLQRTRNFAVLAQRGDRP